MNKNFDSSMGWIKGEERKQPTEIYEYLEKEVDFLNEAKNSIRAKENFSHRDDVYIPDVIVEYSSSRVLVMEFIHGVKIVDIPVIRDKWAFSLSNIGKILFDAISEQIYVYGFVHADPHPANIFVRPKPGNPKLPQIVLLDHGLYYEIPEEFRKNYCVLWKALILNDQETIKNYCDNLGITNHKLYASLLLLQQYDIDIGLNDDDFSKSKGKKNFDFKEFADPKLKADIKNLMEYYPHEMILIMRTYFLLRSVNIQLGAPVNRFKIMARVAVKGIHTKEGNFKYLWERFKFEVMLMVHSWLGWVATKFAKYFVPLPNQNKEIIKV